ncbi:MAG: imidazole glycerol phosphate synthase subunit HisH [Clostridia bacterium]|nr:imidazole glycerol phosphate synthase subunit HisH [Clostridia bacterium]
MIAIVDYGVGNLFSLKQSLTAIGAEAVVTNQPETVLSADRVILPGVGAFADAAKKLSATGLSEVVRSVVDSGKPLLGICLGMQLLFETSYEFGEHKGLGLIPGRVVALKERISPELKIPHIGWNQLSLIEKSGKVHPIFNRIKNGDYVYFVHSYYATSCDQYVIANTDYSIPVTAAVARGCICGCQFHPEKSGDVGLRILKSFCEWSGEEL